MGRGISITMIFKAQSLNYGEGIGNISELNEINKRRWKYLYICF